MGLETVVDDIKQEARARADEIVAEAEEEKEETLSDAREEAEEIVEQARQDAEKEAENLREQEVSSAKLEARKMVSREERDQLAELRADVRDELAELDEGREDMTRTLLESGIEELGDDEGAVYTAEGDEEMVQDLLGGFDGFEHAGSTDIIGGVVVESADGKVRVDNSFDSVLEQVWNESLREVSARLLGDE
ncbi:V-type ATP synthase subunit E [Haladaptatus sp. F3-133]|uniref:A-type ATP synthase subunit E n=1 Tax=Halorutilus salinus TaxID=2487751 RepID=A0A9Q4C577_9EURY|nr:V-type ATP synthase subunit E [Halorutilus salinus]MCX2819164.1 V-type ATP synthase subunit E [Halorutilus salinus]